MFRYLEVDEDTVELFLDVLEEHFSALQNANYKLLFDTKKRMHQGKITLASIETVNDKIRFFSKDKIAVNGYDYIVTIDAKAWDSASPKDKIRLIKHELRHAFIDENGNYKIVGHEIEDFYSEIESNADDPEWRMNLVTLTNDLYEQEKDMKMDNKNER